MSASSAATLQRPADPWRSLREALAREPVVPPAPKPITKELPLWRLILQLRRNALVTWGEPAYELDIVQRPFLGRPSFLLNAPDAIRHVLVDNHANYGRTPATRRILHPMIGDGLFLAEGSAWKHQRRTVAPAFAPRSLDLVADVAADLTDAALDGLAAENRRVVDILAFVQRLTLDVAGRSLFSQAMDKHTPALRAKIEGYGRRLARPGPFDFALPPGRSGPQDYLRRRYGRGWFALVERIMDERTQMPPTTPPRDLFDVLVAARDPESGEGFSRAQLRDQFATLILAGHETTALSLFWSCHLLAQSPAVQEAVAAEAAASDPSPQAMSQLPLAGAVVAEALRLFPPAFTIVRVATEADAIMGHEVPAGSLVVVSPWVLHRHRALWAEPLAFDPTRFLPGAPPVDRFAYLPFGVGPRICIGARFATIEATIVLAKLIRRFRISLVGRPVQPVGVVTVYPERSPAFRLEPR